MGNYFAFFHAGPAKSTRAATAKIGLTVRPTCSSPPPSQVHFMESITNTEEGRFHTGEEAITNTYKSIYADDLPSTNTINSEEYQEQLMLMRGWDNYQLVKHPTIPY